MTGSPRDAPAAPAHQPGRTGVVLVNHDSADDTVACVASLEASHDLDLDIVVVDNSDSPASADALRKLLGGRAEVISSGANLGYAAGSNLGIARCLEQGNDYVWLLNPDTRVEPDTLPRLLQVFEDVPDCGVAGPRIVHPGEPETIWFDGGLVDEAKHGETRHLHQGRVVTDAPPPRRIEVDYVTGASLLARRATLETVGPLPEEYFLYFEETDWCRRAHRAGWRIVVDQRARMVHHKRSSGSLPSPYHLYYMTRNRYLFVERALGGDPEAALEHLRGKWVRTWRRKVRTAAPEWLDEFEALVERGAADARAGRDGRNDEVSHVPWPEDRAGAAGADDEGTGSPGQEGVR